VTLHRLAGITVALLAACPASDDDPAVASEVPARLRDTTGAEFVVVNGDLDELEPADGVELPPACDGEQATEFEFWLGETGLAMICLLDPDSRGPIDVFCRPIACDSPSECTPGFGCSDGVCRCPRGPCRTTPGNGRIEDDELVALCLAGDARSSMCPTGIDHLWVAGPIGTACDEETELCSVPAECRP
jgi:hypothetical protein